MKPQLIPPPTHLLPLLLLLPLAAAVCLPGTYTAACTPCPSGHYAVVGGAAACVQCPEGTDSPPGAAACSVRCGWVEAGVVCPLDHYCPDAAEDIDA